MSFDDVYRVVTGLVILMTCLCGAVGGLCAAADWLERVTEPPNIAEGGYGIE